MALTVTSLAFPGFTANCYFVLDDKTDEGFLVDPGAYTKRHEEYIKSHCSCLRYILLTHGHFDHISGVKQFRDAFDAKVVIHEKDEACLRDSIKSLGISQGLSSPGIKANITVTDGDELDFNNTKIKVIHTPGHTKGGVCYKINDMLFTGDTLFRESVGRTDFPSGNREDLVASVKRLFALNGDYNVYPGHEGFTTLSYERKYNTFIDYD